MDKAMVYMLLLQVIAGDLMPPNETLWSQLPAIEALCPGQDVCAEARPLNRSKADLTSDIEVCCAECSCDPSCIDHGNCCFQRMDRIRDRSDQECLYETLLAPTYSDEPIKSYYMVAHEPKGGCVENFVLDSAYSGLCCEVKVAPWGSFLPVWSASQGRIYKNRLYAECHGVEDYIIWDVSQMCPEVTDLDSDLAECNMHFTFPGRIEEIQTEQCFTDLFDTCPDEFDVNPEVRHLTKQEIRDGCQSDFRLAYDASYHLKNVYCYICMTNPYTMPVRKCRKEGASKSPFGWYKFTCLLSRDYLTEYRPNQNKMPEKACEIEDGESLVESCRQVYCPTGRTYSPVDGRCTFASQSWNIDGLQVWILLTFDNPKETLTYDEVRNLVNSGFSVDVPKKWAIWYAYIPLVDNVSLTADWKDKLLKTIHKNTLQRPAKGLLLSIYPKDKTGDPSKLMDIIQSRLSEKWTVRLGELRLEASARLSNGPLVELGLVQGIGWIHYPYFMKAENNNGSRIFNESNAFLEVVRSLQIEHHVDVINKLYFCRQIELESHEFVLYSETDPFALRLVQGNKYFGSNEFKLRKSGGSLTARICLQDAGYHLFPQTSTARRLRACINGLPFAGLLLLQLFY